MAPRSRFGGAAGAGFAAVLIGSLGPVFAAQGGKGGAKGRERTYSIEEIRGAIVKSETNAIQLGQELAVVHKKAHETGQVYQSMELGSAIYAADMQWRHAVKRLAEARGSAFREDAPAAGPATQVADALNALKQARGNVDWAKKRLGIQNIAAPPPVDPAAALGSDPPPAPDPAKPRDPRVPEEAKPPAPAQPDRLLSTPVPLIGPAGPGSPSGAAASAAGGRPFVEFRGATPDWDGGPSGVPGAGYKGTGPGGAPGAGSLAPGFARQLEKVPVTHAAAARKAELALGLARAGKIGEAAAAAREAAAADPSSAKSWEALAWAQFRQGRYGEAIDSASKAISLDPGSADAHAIRAYSWEKLGNRSAALEDIAKAAELDPGRYGEALRRARAGGLIYDPAEEGPGGRGAGSGGALWGLGALAAILLGAVAWAAVVVTRRGSGAKSPVGAGRASAQGAAGASAEALFMERYEVIRELGGKRGRVFLCRDRSLGREIVVRRLPAAGPMERDALLKAARAAAGLSHAGAAKLYDALDGTTEVCVASEHVPGSRLRERLAEGPMPLSKAAELLRPLAAALDEAHALGVAHGRVHAGNVILRDPDAKSAKLADFGLAGPEAAPEADRAALAAVFEEMAGGPARLPPAAAQAVARARGAAEPQLATAADFLRLLDSVLAPARSAPR